MKILVAVDGSDRSTKAVAYLATNLHWFQSPELHLVNVQLPIPTARARVVLGEDAVENYYNEESRAALAPAEDLLRKKGIGFQSSYAVGDIADAIQAYAEKNGIDMLAMGSHGHGALQSLVMGSVATKVLANTRIPTLILR